MACLHLLRPRAFRRLQSWRCAGVGSCAHNARTRLPAARRARRDNQTAPIHQVHANDCLQNHATHVELRRHKPARGNHHEQQILHPLPCSRRPCSGAVESPRRRCQTGCQLHEQGVHVVDGRQPPARSVQTSVHARQEQTPAGHAPASQNRSERNTKHDVSPTPVAPVQARGSELKRKQSSSSALGGRNGRRQVMPGLEAQQLSLHRDCSANTTPDTQCQATDSRGRHATRQHRASPFSLN